MSPAFHRDGFPRLHAAVAAAPPGAEVGVAVSFFGTDLEYLNEDYLHDADRVLPAASTVKLLILLALADVLEMAASDSRIVCRLAPASAWAAAGFSAGSHRSGNSPCPISPG